MVGTSWKFLKKTGFYSDNGGYQYISNTEGVYEAETVRQAKYRNCPADDIDYQVLKFRLENEKLPMMLTVLDMASFMYTILRGIRVKFSRSIFFSAFLIMFSVES